MVGVCHTIYADPCWMVWLQDMEGLDDPQLIVNIMMRIHQSALPRGVTPRQYMSFVHCYKTIILVKKTDLQQQRDFLAVRKLPCSQCLRVFGSSAQEKAAFEGLCLTGWVGETS